MVRVFVKESSLRFLSTIKTLLKTESKGAILAFLSNMLIN